MRSFDHGAFEALTDDDVNFEGVVTNPDNFCFLSANKNAGLMFIRLAPGVYHVHTYAKETGRGPSVVNLARESLVFMFAQTDCLRVISWAWESNFPAIRLMEHCGFLPTHDRKGYPGAPAGVTTEFFDLTYERWVMTEPRLRLAGEDFHFALEQRGVHTNHAQDDAHDRWAGATYLGCLHGNVAKAILAYNIWATVTGYVPARIASLQPALVDIGSAVLQFDLGRMDVLKARDLPPS